MGAGGEVVLHKIRKAHNNPKKKSKNENVPEKYILPIGRRPGGDLLKGEKNEGFISNCQTSELI